MGDPGEIVGTTTPSFSFPVSRELFLTGTVEDVGVFLYATQALFVTFATGAIPLFARNALIASIFMVTGIVLKVKN